MTVVQYVLVETPTDYLHEHGRGRRRKNIYRWPLEMEQIKSRVLPAQKKAADWLCTHLGDSTLPTSDFRNQNRQQAQLTALDYR